MCYAIRASPRLGANATVSLARGPWHAPIRASLAGLFHFPPAWPWRYRRNCNNTIAIGDLHDEKTYGPLALQSAIRLVDGRRPIYTPGAVLNDWHSGISHNRAPNPFRIGATRIMAPPVDARAARFNSISCTFLSNKPIRLTPGILLTGKIHPCTQKPCI